MEQGTSTPTIHPLKLLAYAYGLMPEIEPNSSLQAETRNLMKVEVRLFARARDAAGAERVTVELPASARVGRFACRTGRTIYPNLPPGPSLLVAVGNDYAGDEAVLGEDSEIACFPPVSGG